jgi:phosphopantothenoylcysteine decarboxylase
MDRTCLLIICAAPLARRAPDVAQALGGGGWTVLPVATPEAFEGWADREALQRMTGFPVRSSHRAPDSIKVLRDADAVVVCPATFNTIGKLANGIADNYALGIVAEAIGAGTPTLLVPFVNEKLSRHPALVRNLSDLESAGVIVFDPQGFDDRLRGIPSGTGDQVAAHFDPRRLVSVLAARTGSSGT